MESEVVEMMNVENVCNLFYCEGGKKVGAVIGEDCWIRGYFTWFCF